ncbi:Ankyrin-3 [Symbiodinium microadriaticum]|uniref:Ankyrin-3 n=1 Tax=Symbiodinium microadriaticum TaxID=2951 RepID=A0A1Q9DWI0_SYMMI|nr:Ankyrin-3 [Symbiodinium microadriaticum]CAE7792655.1 Ank3 [Symbiodinium sp. KB8]
MLHVWRASGEEICAVPVAELTDVRALKRRLHRLCGVPRFRQKLLVWNGGLMADEVLLQSPMDLQLILLPFAEASEDDIDDLIGASDGGSVEGVEAVLNRPQNPDAMNSKRGFSALGRAADLGHVEVAQLLLEAGADPDLQSMNGFGHVLAPLQIAARQGHVELLRLLLEARADQDTKHSHDMTPLAMALEMGHTESVSVLVAAGAEQPRGTSASESGGEWPKPLALRAQVVETASRASAPSYPAFPQFALRYRAPLMILVFASPVAKKSPRKRHVKDFRAYLERLFGGPGGAGRAWRTALDVKGTGAVSVGDFGSGCRAVGWKHDHTEMWKLLKAAGGGVVCLRALDPQTAEALDEFKDEAMMRTRSIHDFWTEDLDPGGVGAVSRNEFLKDAGKALRLPRETLIRVFNVLDTTATGWVSLAEFGYLEAFETKIAEALAEEKAKEGQKARGYPISHAKSVPELASPSRAAKLLLPPGVLGDFRLPWQACENRGEMSPAELACSPLGRQLWAPQRSSRSFQYRALQNSHTLKHRWLATAIEDRSLCTNFEAVWMPDASLRLSPYFEFLSFCRLFRSPNAPCFLAASSRAAEHRCRRIVAPRPANFIFFILTMRGGTKRVLATAAYLFGLHPAVAVSELGIHRGLEFKDPRAIIYNGFDESSVSVAFILDNQFGATTFSGRVRIYAFAGHFLSTSISWDCVVGGGGDYMKYRGTISEEKITGTFEYSVNGFGGGGNFRLQAKDTRRTLQAVAEENLSRALSIKKAPESSEACVEDAI